MNTKNIMLIGRVDPTSQLVDGQTVKSRTLYEGLTQKTDMQVFLVETKDYRKRPLSVMRQLLHGLRHCDDVILVVSRNGRRVFFPLMYVFARVFKKRIYHDAIGGRLANEAVSHPRWKKYLNSFHSNWVESEDLAQSLHQVGVSNAIYVPNFKFIAAPQEAEKNLESPYRFCTFSRVTREKGITFAAETLHRLNQETDKQYTLDVYGPVEDAYRSEFERLLEEYSFMQYRGVARPEEGAEILSAYHALLFPTQWKGEGMPGTILDALTAGTPVIASRWRYYDQMLKDGVTGFSYPLEQPEKLHDAIQEFVGLTDSQYKQMQENCKEFSKQYSGDVIFAEILNIINYSKDYK